MKYLVKRNAILLHKNAYKSYPFGTAYVLCGEVGIRGDFGTYHITLCTEDGIYFILTDAELEEQAIQITEEMVEKLRNLTKAG
jgi:hypothetical protein